MATLNLGNFTGFKNGSVVGYNKDKGFTVVKNGTLDTSVYTDEGSLATVAGGWTITGKHSDVTGFVETDKTWSLTFSKVEGDGVVLGSGADSVTVADASDATINLGDGKNTLYLGAATNTTVTLGDGADSVVVAGLESSTVRTGAGKDVVQIGATDNTDTVVDLGDDNDSVYFTGAATLNLTLGDGKDSVDATGLTGGTVTLTDYNVAEDVLVSGYASVSSALVNKLGSDGSVSVNGGGVVKVNAENGYYAINGAVEKYVAWATEEGSNIDLSSVTKSVTIVGNDNESVDTLIGGTKADTIVAGGGDLVYGGAGNDYISLSNTGSDSVSFVGLAAAGGKDSVGGFTAGSGSDADVVYLFENGIGEGAKLSLTNKTDGQLVVTQGSANLTLVNTSVSGGKAQAIKIQDNTNNTYTVDFVNGFESVAGADSIASIYYGNTSRTDNTIDFSAVEESLVVDLGNTGIFQNTGNAVYAGKFASVLGGQAETILMGSADASETLTAGTGSTTLWGGGAKADVLDGGSSNSATDNVVTYFYTAGDGKDTVKNFVTGTAENNADVLYLSNVGLSKIDRNGKTVTISTTESTDKLVVELGTTSVDSVIQYTTDGQTVNQVEIGNSSKSNTFAYSNDVQAYMGGKNNTLKVNSDVDSADIWLDGSHGVSYENITKVDASSSSNSVLAAGNGSVNETIIGGSGDNSLWGGAGTSNDTLQGSYGGTNTFFFGKGDGKDVITGSSSDDKVVLYNVALGDVTSVDVTSSNMKIGLNDGSTLTVKNMSTTSVSTFELGDGSSWKYDYASKTWSQK